MNTRFNPFGNDDSGSSEPDNQPPKAPKRRRRSSNVNAQKALNRIQSNPSVANFSAVYAAFAEKGIPMDNIKPKENVLTFTAWKAKGRCVKKGEKGVKVVSWIEIEGKPAKQGEKTTRKQPIRACLFHVTQTKALDEPKAQPEANTPDNRHKPAPTEDDDGMPSWLTE